MCSIDNYHQTEDITELNYQNNPEAKRIYDIENLLPEIKHKFENRCRLNSAQDIDRYAHIFYYITDSINNNYDSLNSEVISKLFKTYQKDHKFVVNRRKLFQYYVSYIKGKGPEFGENKYLENLLVGKKVRSHSGVLVITVFTSPYPEDKNGVPQKFSCAYDCAYCPNEPDQPRSYLLREPGVLRANQEKFDSYSQIMCRLRALENMGHPLDKLEILILGGTFTSYPRYYIKKFIRDLFYAANTYFDINKRDKMSLLEEQNINQTTLVKIIGITIETRPDTIDLSFIKFARKLGVTRVQLGVQHIDDFVLRKINRKAYLAHTIFALKVLKNFGFKIDIHLMPNLPYSSPELDKMMFERVLEDPDLQADQWKIYPCEIVPWTKIKQWYDEGKYIPYDDDLLKEIIIQTKSNIHPWIRLNRIIRDIPSEYVCGGFDNPSLRDHIKKEMHERGLVCKCIRCREVKSGNICSEKDLTLTIHKYEASSGQEYFISFTNKDDSVLYGFLRLRLPDYKLKDSSLYNDLYSELPSNIAWIRELHVYGKIQTTYGDKSDVNEGVQHQGIGKRLLYEAERICFENGYKDIAVIAGVGTREYYKKRGFQLMGKQGGFYMVRPVEYKTIVLYQNKYLKLLNTKTYLTILTLGLIFAIGKYFI